MKKILITIDWFLPGYKAGGPISSIANLVAHLKNEFEFFIITRNTDYLESKPYDIESDTWVSFDKNTNVFYISEKNCTKNFISNLIINTKFDIIYINGIYSYFFSILPLLIAKKIKSKKIIVCARGMLSKQAFSRKSFKKNIFLYLAKLRSFYKNVLFHATNENEKNDILNLIGKKTQIFVTPNLPKFLENIVLEPKIKQENILKLVSIARISHEKNTKFALEVLKNIKNYQIEFDIYGSIYDESYWKECENIISQMSKNIIIRVKNPINPNLVLQTFSKYHFSFMPSIGENFGHSLLESMMAGTPIITSKNTPWINLENQNIGWDIDLKNVEKFINIIENCALISQEKYNQLSENCFNFAKEITKVDNLKEQYFNLFENE